MDKELKIYGGEKVFDRLFLRKEGMLQFTTITK